MSVFFDVRQFKSTTGAAATTIDVALSLGGLAPKVIWVWSMGRTEAVGVDGVGLFNINMSYSFAVSTASRRCVAAHMSQTLNPTSEDRAFRNDCVGISMAVATGAIDGLLDVNNMSNPDTVQFIIDQQFAADELFLVAALAGTDVSSVAIVDVDKSTSAGVPFTTNVTSPGFMPKYVEAISGNAAGAFQQGPTATAVMSIGRSFPESGTNQVFSFVEIDSQGTVDCACYMSDQQNYVSMGTTTIGTRSAITGQIANGFAWEFVENDATARKVSFLCLGGNFAVASFLLNTQAGQQTIGALLGTTLRGGLAFSACNVVSTNDTPMATAQGSLGAFCGPQDTGRSMCQGFISVDNVLATADKAGAATRSADLYVNMSTTDTVEGAMGIDTAIPPDPGLFVLKENVTDATANVIFGVAFGEPFPPPPGSTAIRDMIDRHQTIPAPR